MNKTTTYQPRHQDGRTGPSFDFATMACLWILQQADAAAWSWEGKL